MVLPWPKKAEKISLAALYILPIKGTLNKIFSKGENIRFMKNILAPHPIRAITRITLKKTTILAT